MNGMSRFDGKHESTPALESAVIGSLGGINVGKALNELTTKTWIANRRMKGGKLFFGGYLHADNLSCLQGFSGYKEHAKRKTTTNKPYITYKVPYCPNKII